MSLSISEKRVEELLASSVPGYAVTPSLISQMSFGDSLPAGAESIAVSGTMFRLPAFTTETREYLLSLRRKIVESQIPLKTGEELDRDIEEIKKDDR